MPDRFGITRLYVGHLSSRTRSRDLDDLFSKYGRVREVDLKRGFAFVEFSDPRDADDAIYGLNGREFDGSRIVVEFVKTPRGGSRGGSHERGPPPGSGRCFNCGVDGHWARDCKAGDGENKCYRCGERGHVERNCQNSPKSHRRERSYSLSPSPRGGKGRGRSYSRSRSPARRRERSISMSPSRSRSPARRRERSISMSPSRSRSPAPRRERSISMSPRYSRSPKSKKSPPSSERKRSISPDGSGSPQARVGPPPNNTRERNGSGDERKSPANNGRSPDPRDDDDDDRSPRGSESPQD